MVNFYNSIDLIFIIAIILLTKISYEKRIYIKIFEYFKIFMAITLSAKLAGYTAIFLQKFLITKADTYTTLILISFVVNILILYFGWKYIFAFSNKFMQNTKVRTFFAKMFTFLEVVTMLTFSLYILMQLYISKAYLYKTMKKSYTYPKIEKFYNSFLNDDFVNMILNSDTGTNHKEIIFKSFKNSF
ncbi:hypothetical protein OAR97_00025 [Arcobacteraceae bacterium]|nr:hypothetical protein [Arcobacteraceae bacterium]